MTDYPQTDLEKTFTPVKEQAKDYAENKFSDEDKNRITKVSIVGIICITIILTITGSMSIYTSHVIQKMRMTLQFATGTQGK